MKVMPLTRGQVTIVDDEDYDRLMKHSWAWVPSTSSLSSAGYAVRKGSKRRGEPRTVQMHREILHAPKGTMIDHINLNSLDNRKENLRYADVHQNGFNRPKPIMDCTSKYKGVLRRLRPANEAKPWTARIKYNDRHVELGTYPTEELAAGVYNYASRIFFGQFRHENEGVDEIPPDLQAEIFRKAGNYIERYGWYVDTELYQQLHFKEEPS